MIETQTLIGEISTENELKANISSDNLLIGELGKTRIKPTPSYVSFARYGGETLDVSWLDTSNMTDMSRMFESCSNLLELNIRNFTSTNVNNMSRMFSGCSRLVTLNVKNLTSVSNGNYTNMFYSCSRVRTLYLNKFDFRNVSDANSMMNGIPKSTTTTIYVLDQYAKDTLEALNYRNVIIAN
ncbi:BspA family leucine-rich repeat surface protein [bacterium]|nr:BspA family leucine-rich repeat surface protein [bacterium]